MIEEPTVLILGAGSSLNYGYPSGSQLREKIINNLQKRNSPTYKEILDCGFSNAEISQFVTDLSKSKVYTIDEFLEHRDDCNDICKIAIAQILIPCEDSNLLFNIREEYDWYRRLKNRISTQFDSLNLNKLSIITFNYDRSLEEYLFTTFKHQYNKNSELALKLQKIPIVHVHGVLNELPWQNANGRGYNPDTSTNILTETANCIKTMHDNNDNFLKTEKIFENLHQVEGRVYFLGFGYDKTNLSNLGILNNFYEETKDGIKELKVFGTAYQLSDYQKNFVSNSFKGRIRLGHPQDDCLSLLNKHDF